MKQYQFNTEASIKPNDTKKWFISYDLISTITVSADSLRDALQKYAAIIDNKFCVTISKNALKNKRSMYIDGENGEAIQTGYVITAKTMFDDAGRGWIDKYIDLWISIHEINRVKFSDIAA